MSNKIIIMQGLPGSGKSTESKRIQDISNIDGKFPTIRLNRDSLRTMFWPGYKWSPEFEELIVDIETLLAKQLLSQGFNVIIDDTNLDPKVVSKWRKLSKKENILVSFIKVPLETCIIRNEKRKENNGNWVSPEVIFKLARKHNLLK